MKAATALIHTQALQHNLRIVREQAPTAKVVAVVKANAYGHGLLPVARTLKEADAYAVARIEEALSLRSGGIVKPVILLEGFFSADDLPVLAANNLQTAVHSWEQLEALEQADLPQPIRAWVKLDTGMHRLGVHPDEATTFFARLAQCKNVVQPFNLMTHFSCADELENPATHEQIELFKRLAQGMGGECALSNSAGVLAWKEAHADWVRPGIILYGVSPMDEPYASHFDLLPAMALKSSLIAVREHKAGEPVGYGGTWVSEHDTRLGVVAIGYGDGYPRSAPSGTPMWVNGREVCIVGRVSMDMISVDLGPNSSDKVGDEVLLWGADLPVEKIAAYTGISAYELITKLTSRVAMEYLGE